MCVCVHMCLYMCVHVCVLVKLSLSFTSSRDISNLFTKDPSKDKDLFRRWDLLPPHAWSLFWNQFTWSSHGIWECTAVWTLGPARYPSHWWANTWRGKQFSHKSSLDGDKIWRNISPALDVFIQMPHSENSPAYCAKTQHWLSRLGASTIWHLPPLLSKEKLKCYVTIWFCSPQDYRHSRKGLQGR